jgi:hypothetical protein
MKISNASAKYFRQPAYSVSYKGGRRDLLKKETLWKNNLSFDKCVPIISINFIVTVITVAEKK